MLLSWPHALEEAERVLFVFPWGPPDYIKRMRYCEYLGKYFCQCCHENSQMVIPSRILRKWDFSKYYVSNFSKDLLSKIWSDPLFNVQDINTALYRKVKPLNQVRVSRRVSAGLSLRLFPQDVPKAAQVLYQFCQDGLLQTVVGTNDKCFELESFPAISANSRTLYRQALISADLVPVDSVIHGSKGPLCPPCTINI